MNIDYAVGRRQEVMWFTDNAINIGDDEVAVEHLSIVTSLIRTCRRRGNNPYTSILDGPRRFETHPGSTVGKVSRHVWKTLFADEPLRSDLALATANQTLSQDVTI
jgi:hypothetical protein